MPEHLDVVIVGAGLSGIGMAWHLQDRCPGKTYAILEGRDASGGTWDLFRYPGVRSDSDMQTLGYRFKPWTGRKALADGPSILRYVRETAAEAGIDQRIRYRHKVVRAEWSTPDARWTVHIEGREPLTCRFLLMCSGYYRYDEGYTPRFDGEFGGPVVHPQFWPEDLDYADKRIVVIGSGATAVTLVPALAESGAGHVTMLQRSPSYVLSLPDEDPIATALRRRIGDRRAYAIVRWKNVALATLLYQVSQRLPRTMRRLFRAGAIRRLPAGFAVDTHFNPRYDPWDQRLCLVPNGDLFDAVSEGTASIVTDEIERFTPRGIALKSGEDLEADVIVTATGLNLLAFGGVAFAVDGEEVELPRTMAYKSMMLSGVPNFVYTLGYTNISWTLKADLVSEYACKLIRHMDARGYTRAVPVRDPSVSERPFLDFMPGYVVRSLHELPKQGSREPWRLSMTYMLDVLKIRLGRVDDGVLELA
ncbi:MAG TPA: NAD(P)/FAD-dependent oxidoreductase [Candidatus Limnocylindria bacterium]|nr:NAD(P)/FAD-dependent oxidoreductase [Candidatus Limnocylindria bacterium]